MLLVQKTQQANSFLIIDCLQKSLMLQKRSMLLVQKTQQANSFLIILGQLPHHPLGTHGQLPHHPLGTHA
jgi:hypothetical protein